MMSFERRSALACGLLTFSLLASVSGAKAGAFEVRTQSAAGFGTAIAGVAAGGQLSYSYWNPATLSDIDSLQVEGVANGIFSSINLTPSAATNAILSGAGGVPSGRTGIGKDALVPASYIAMPLNDRVSIGLAINSPFGLSTEAPYNWAGQVYARDSGILALNVNPMASYRVNDWLSLGAGLQVQYFKARLTQAAGIAAGSPSATLKADDVGVGFNLGAQIRPWAGGTIGIGYRSAISQDLDGSLKAFGTGTPANAQLTTPDVISFGIRQEVNPRMRVLGTVEWTNWSRIDTINVKASGSGVTLTQIPLRYRDGWLFSAGAEYDLDKKTTLRGGVGYEVAPVTDITRGVNLPEPNQLILSAGIAYHYNERTTFDLAFTQSIGLGKGPVNIDPGDPRFVGLPFSATSDLNVSIVSASVRMKFDSMARASR